MYKGGPLERRKQEEERAKALVRIQSDPMFFINKGLGGPPRWSKQVELIESVRDNQETIVISGHGLGKTSGLADVAIWFLNAFHPSKVITLAPTKRQVESLLWAEIRSKFEQSLIQLPGEPGRSYWEISPTHFALGMSPDLSASAEDQGVKLQGQHSPHILVIFDEAMGIEQAFWDAKEALMTSAHARFCAVMNPTAASGPAYEAWRRGGGHKIRMSMFDSPNFRINGIKDLADLERMIDWPDKKIEKEMKIAVPALTSVFWAVKRLQKWGASSPLFMSRVLATWPTQGVDALFGLAWLEACVDIVLKPKDENNKNKVLGVDVARFGSASTVLIGLDEGSMCHHEVYQGQDTTWTANRVIELIRRDAYTAVAIDTTGLGAGVTDQVNSWIADHDHPCVIIAFEGGRKPSDEERFTDLRSEAYWTLREMVQNKEIGLEDKGELFHQLTNLKYRYAKGSLIDVESKDQMRRRAIASPDEADALSMAAYAAKFSGAGKLGGGADDKWLDQFVDDSAARSASKTPWRNRG